MFRLAALACCLVVAAAIAWDVRAGAHGLAADLVRAPTMAFSPTAGWAVLAAAILAMVVALTRALRGERFSLVDAARGILAVLLGAFLALEAAGLVQRVASSGGAPAEAALAVACFAALAAGVLAAGIGRTRFWSAFAGAFLVETLLAANLVAHAPRFGVALAWPSLAAAALACAAVFRWRGDWRRPCFGVFAASVGALALSQLLYLTLKLGFRPDAHAGTGYMAAFAAIVLFPLLWPLAPRLDRRQQARS
jgi:hypothetical protein